MFLLAHFSLFGSQNKPNRFASLAARNQFPMVNEHPNPRKRFAVNTVLSVASWFFPLALAFIATPIIVRGLGNEQYGVFAIALGFVSYAFSSGIGRISAKYIPEFRSSG